MKVYVINLERSVSRRENTLRDMRKHGLDYEIVKAVDGAGMSDDEFSRVPVTPEVNGNDYYTRSIICAALSHANVYQRILDHGDDVALVLEDDVVLCENFGDVLTGIRANIKRSEIVLCHFMSFDTVELPLAGMVPVADGFGLYSPRNIARLNSGAAYMITRAAAESMLKTVIPVQAEADSWEMFQSQGGFESIRLVYPMPATARGDKSTIHVDRQSGLRKFVTTAIHEYRVPPFYQILRTARLRSIASRSRVAIVDETDG